jgi:hypothetical protein
MTTAARAPRRTSTLEINYRSDWVEAKGSRQQLIAGGLLRDGEFPRDPGQRRHIVRLPTEFGEITVQLTMPQAPGRFHVWIPAEEFRRRDARFHAFLDALISNAAGTTLE